MAALLDFTDHSLISSLTTVANGYSGSINGVGFTLTSSDGTVNFTESYDGSFDAGCQSSSGPLKCDKDGAGIEGDEISGISGQTLVLSFDSVVSLTRFYFLDLYIIENGGETIEQASIILDGIFFNTVEATGTPGDGGYAQLATAPILAQTIEFTAITDSEFWACQKNDYAFAGVDVSVVNVPEPLAIMIFGSVLTGLVGIRRFKTIN
jgi:hypothetical protein